MSIFLAYIEWLIGWVVGFGLVSTQKGLTVINGWGWMRVKRFQAYTVNGKTEKCQLYIVTYKNVVSIKSQTSRFDVNSLLSKGLLELSSTVRPIDEYLCTSRGLIHHMS